MTTFIAKATVCESYLVDFCKEVELEVEAESEDAANFLAERAMEKIETESKNSLKGVDARLTEWWLDGFQITQKKQESKNV